MGDGSDFSPIPRLISLSGAVTSVKVFGYNACAVAEGSLYCWGQSYGKFPKKLLEGGVSNFQMSQRRVCAQKDGALYCGGIDREMKVLPLEGIEKYSVSDSKLCVLKEEELFCSREPFKASDYIYRSYGLSSPVKIGYKINFINDQHYLQGFSKVEGYSKDVKDIVSLGQKTFVLHRNGSLSVFGLAGEKPLYLQGTKILINADHAMRPLRVGKDWGITEIYAQSVVSAFVNNIDLCLKSKDGVGRCISTVNNSDSHEVLTFLELHDLYDFDDFVTNGLGSGFIKETRIFY